MPRSATNAGGTLTRPRARASRGRDHALATCARCGGRGPAAGGLVPAVRPGVAGTARAGGDHAGMARGARTGGPVPRAADRARVLRRARVVDERRGRRRVGGPHHLLRAVDRAARRRGRGHQRPAVVAAGGTAALGGAGGRARSRSPRRVPLGSVGFRADGDDADAVRSTRRRPRRHVRDRSRRVAAGLGRVVGTHGPAALDRRDPRRGRGDRHRGRPGPASHRRRSRRGTGEPHGRRDPGRRAPGRPRRLRAA